MIVDNRKSLVNGVSQEFASYSLQAKSGPPPVFIWPQS